MKLLLVSLVVPLVLAQVASSAAPSAPPSAPRHFPAADVAASFARSGPLFETTAYQIHTSRRDAPGMVEVHARETDIMYILDGTATIVTGGTVVGGKTVSPGETRGENLRGGNAQTLTKGDVFVVPNGVPHWFRDVPSSIQYYVVKVTAPAR
jgi:mannose-6-phosphate isomerase-like protein (cupin superfamily)